MINEHYANNMDENLRKQIQDRRRMLQDSDPAIIGENVRKQVHGRRQILQETPDPNEFKISSEPPRKTHKHGRFLLSVTTFFVSSLMVYVGVRYNCCEDIFSPWLITGGVLNIVDVILLLLVLITSKEWIIIFAYLISLAIFIWWIFGLSRIGSGYILKEQIHIKDNPICKWYFYWIPLWLTLMPFLIIVVVFCVWFIKIFV